MNASNILKGLAVSSDSEPEVKPFITQTKAVSFAGAENEQAIDNFNFRTEDQSTDLHVYRQRRFRARITTVTDKEIHDQSRNEARIPQNTKRSTPLLIHYSLMPVSISLAEKSLLLKVQLKLACFCLFVCFFLPFYSCLTVALLISFLNGEVLVIMFAFS